MPRVQSISSLLASDMSRIRQLWEDLPGQRHSALRDLRQKALDAIEKAGLPGRKTEEYKHIPIAQSLEKAYSALGGGSSLAKPAEALVPGFDCHWILLNDGQLMQASPGLSKSGLTVTPLNEVAESNPEKLIKLLSLPADPFALWNLSTWGAGILVEGSSSLPLWIIHNNTGTLAHYRVHVHVESGKELSVVESYLAGPGATGISNGVTQVDLGTNSILTWLTVQDSPPNSYSVNNFTLAQGTSSVSNVHTCTLGGGLIRNNLTAILDGEHIEAHLNGLYLLSDQSIADNHTVVDHRKPNSVSNELYKGILDGHARGVFNGKIYVRPQAQKTNAFQSNRNILLSESAQVHTKPQLEIWADDVKCSHGCTTGQLDEEAMFYLQSRGITPDGARAMLLEAFAGDVLNRIPFAAVREHLRLRILERLQANLS